MGGNLPKFASFLPLVMIMVLGAQETIAQTPAPKPAAKPKQRALAVIVNLKNPLKNITSKELQKTMTLEKRFWSNKKAIVLLQRPRKSIETKIVLKHIYKMSSRKLKKYWVSKLFNGKISGIPSTIRSSKRVIRAVAKSESAISVIFADEATTAIRILKIDGKSPKDKGYNLKTELKE